MQRGGIKIGMDARNIRRWLLGKFAAGKIAGGKIRPWENSPRVKFAAGKLTVRIFLTTWSKKL